MSLDCIGKHNNSDIYFHFSNLTLRKDLPVHRCYDIKIRQHLYLLKERGASAISVVFFIFVPQNWIQQSIGFCKFSNMHEVSRKIRPFISA